MVPRLLLAALLLAPTGARAQLTPPAADAQIPPLVEDYILIQGLTGYEVATLPPKDIVTGAFGTDYGRALVAEFGDILIASADQSCLQSKKLAPAEVTRQAGDIYVRYGARMIDVSRSLINTRAYETALAARAPKLHAELASLRDDDVQKLIALEQPTRFSGIADFVIENLDRYMLIKRIKLSKSLSGIARGDMSLAEKYLPEETLEARYQFVVNSTSPRLKRYIELIKIMAEARGTGIDQSAAARVGPIQLAAGIEADLAALCIPEAK